MGWTVQCDSCLNQLQSSAEDLQLAGVEEQRDGNVFSGERGTYGKDMPVCTCIGAWSMVVVLWQFPEY